MRQLIYNNFLNKPSRFLSSFMFLLSTLLLFVNSTVSAWWDEGHLAVAQIAYEELQPEVIHKVEPYLDAVSGSFPNHSDFVMASVWADDIVHDGINSFLLWHGSARPYDPEGILSLQEKEIILAKFEGNDIVWAIDECKKTLKNPNATPWAKGFMLRMLIHIVGDIHQPIHCTTYYSHNFPKGDRAGTRYRIKHEKYESIHQLFDGAFGLGDHRPERPMTEGDKRHLSDLVFYLKTEFPRDSLPQLVEKKIDSWRQESYDIGVNFGYGNIALNESPSEQVMMEGKIVTGKQLALAGYRLADLLNDILGGN
ncbi:MAG: hypothetical protein K940chlam7_01080 [Chlamydiae bacterium]|nr:hypothetical protein [Chlamydiota bacterium]